jgi:hypothetical protein
VSITLTNPENYPKDESFREGVVQAAQYYYVRMNKLEYDETGTRDEACTQLAVDTIRAAEVAIAVLQVQGLPRTYTFFTVMGADVLHAAMMTPDKPAEFTLVGFPVFSLEDAITLRRFCGDGAGLQ